MADFEERAFGGLRVRIDRTLCVGFGDCVESAPEAFELDGDSVAIFLRPEAVEPRKLLDACRQCPVDALTVWDDNDHQLVP